jgi:hypothetical protein
MNGVLWNSGFWVLVWIDVSLPCWPILLVLCWFCLLLRLCPVLVCCLDLLFPELTLGTLVPLVPVRWEPEKGRVVPVVPYCFDLVCVFCTCSWTTVPFVLTIVLPYGFYSGAVLVVSPVTDLLDFWLLSGLSSTLVNVNLCDRLSNYGLSGGDYWA